MARLIRELECLFAGERASPKLTRKTDFYASVFVNSLSRTAAEACSVGVVTFADERKRSR